MQAYINIGSNQGDRSALIERAVALVAESYPECPLRRSDFIESKPWGYSSPYPFLNLGIALELEGEASEASALELLSRLLSIQNSISNSPHRHADGSYRDRAIDIDLIAIDFLRMRTPKLTLPHPRAHQRLFVMKPMAQLAPDAYLKKLWGNSKDSVSYAN